MVEKKRQIIEAAMKSFAEKGYHATSIQDIVDSLGIAKGSLYFYFKSKEDLLVSIIKYFMELFMTKFQTAVENPGRTPRERLHDLIEFQYLLFLEHRDFILMLVHERFEMTEEIRDLMITMQMDSLVRYRKCILDVYGEQAAPYLYDAAVLFQTMIDGYIKFVVLGSKSWDIKVLGDFLADRLDDIVSGMITKNVQPMLDSDFFGDEKLLCRRVKSDVFEALDELRAAVNPLDLTEEQVAELESSLRVMEEEFEKVQPQSVVLKGLLAYLKSLKIPELKKSLSRLQTFIK